MGAKSNTETASAFQVIVVNNEYAGTPPATPTPLARCRSVRPRGKFVGVFAAVHRARQAGGLAVWATQ